MGVKDLWNILSPASDRRPLYELQGKTIAIDLSCWVVENQQITDNVIQPKMYLRNLFFRTSYFLLHNIFPVFVLEGTAPSLKHKTIAKRNEIRHGGEETKKKKKGGRSHFNYILLECEEMLKYMGVSCVRAHGEAEAMCAYLNEDGLVDGCISQDSDCFLYGAKVVYRNYCTSTQGNRTTSGGSIDEYSIDKIQQIFNLGRNKMIALALLCGCDYDEGLFGVGKEAALKLFKLVEDNEILNRIKEWQTDAKFNKMEKELSNPDICTNCGHFGKMKSHTKIGCIDCGTSVRCSDTYKEKRTLISNELAIRKKALLKENFPNQELIDEFLIRKGSVPSKLDLQWKKPMIVKFINFMEKKVQWEGTYAFAKIFSLVTRWQLINLIELPIERRFTAPDVFVPEKIKKIRNIRTIASYEILWIDKDNLLKGLDLTTMDSDKENDEEESPDALSELVTIEPQELVIKCYPNIVEDFDALRNAKKKKPTRSRKKKIEENSEQPVEKKKPEKKKRGKTKSDEVTNNKKIVDFILKRNREPTLEESFGRLSITPKRRKESTNINTPTIKKRGPQFDKIMTAEQMDSILNGSLETLFHQLTPEDFASDVDISVMDMSIIIDSICNSEGKQENICIEYQENVSVNTQKHEHLTEYEDNVIEEKDHQIDTCINHKTNILNDSEESDEFDKFNVVNTNYVPLEMRLLIEKNGNDNRNSMICDNNECSIGIDSLLNSTDD